MYMGKAFHRLNFLYLVILAGLTSGFGIDPFPPPYSSSFREPSPPLIPTELTANYMQQKYDDTGINHIVAGFVFFSPSQKKIRADGADGSLFNSIFDFGNMTAQGEVSNRQLVFSGGVKASEATCFSEFVVPGFQLFSADILNSTGAVFMGVQQDALYGPTNVWQFQFQVPSPQTSPTVTAYLDANNTMVRFDFAAPGSLRTFTTTRFFNILIGPVNASVFESDCN